MHLKVRLKPHKSTSTSEGIKMSKNKTLEGIPNLPHGSELHLLRLLFSDCCVCGRADKPRLLQPSGSELLACCRRESSRLLWLKILRRPCLTASHQVWTEVLPSLLLNRLCPDLAVHWDGDRNQGWNSPESSLPSPSSPPV